MTESVQPMESESTPDVNPPPPSRSLGPPLNSLFFGSMPAQPPQNAAQELTSRQRIRSSWLGELRTQHRRLRLFHDTEDNQYWPEIFGTSPWFSQLSPWLLFIRAGLACLFIFVWTYSLVQYFDQGFWFIYLTHWSLTIETLYFCFATYTTYAALKILRKRREALFDGGVAVAETGTLPFFTKATWVLLHIAMPAAWLVMLMYWTAVNPIWKPKTTPDLLTCFVHGINFFLCLADLFLGRNIFYLPHVAWFFAYMTTYCIWTIVHFWLGIGVADGCSDTHGDFINGRGCPIYGIVDWAKPSMTGILALLLLLCVVPMCQFPIWWCIRARRTADYFNTSARRARQSTSSEEHASP